MTARIYTVEEIRNIVHEIAPKYGVERVSLFGSYARGEAKPDSDIDLRIEKGRIMGLFPGTKYFFKRLTIPIKTWYNITKE